MGKRTIMRFIGRCQVTKTERKGKETQVTMKCPGNKKIKVTMAQDLIDHISER